MIWSVSQIEPEKSVRLRKTHEDVYGKLSRDFFGEKKKFSGDFRETNASFLVAVSKLNSKLWLSFLTS